MSFFNKIFASIGIGSAKIDTKLEQLTYRQGDIVKGIVEIKGGNVEQKINGLYLNLYTSYIKEMDDKKVPAVANIGHFPIFQSLLIKANEVHEVPFSFQLPFDTPVTFGRSKVWVKTEADISNALDPTDKDYIRIAPSPIMNAVIDAINELGFTLREVENERAPRYIRSRLPLIQEFEFVPYQGPFRSRLDELELVFFNQSEHRVELLMEIDHRVRGFKTLLAEALDMDESKVRMTVTTEDIPSIKEKIYQIINRYSL